MKRLLLFFLCVSTVTLFTACSKPDSIGSQQQQPPGRVVKGDATLVDELLDKSGLNARIAYLPSQVLKTTDDYLRRGIVEVDAVRDTLNETYNPSALRAVVRAHLLDNLDEKHVNDVLAWLDTDLGRKITAQEVAGADPKQVHHIMTQYHQLAKDESRVTLMQQLVSATGAAEHRVDVSLAMERSLQLALNQLLPEANQVSEAEFISREQDERPLLEQRQGKYAEAIYLYNYKNLSDDEINKYISFSQSTAARAFHHEVSEAFQKAVSSAGKKASLKIAALHAG